jgi:hypothetical protein
MSKFNFTKVTESLGEIAKEIDKSRKLISANNRASRRSKGKQQEQSKWKRNNVTRRFYE